MQPSTPTEQISDSKPSVSNHITAVTVRTAQPEDAGRVAQLAAEEIALDAANADVVRRVIEHNSECLFVFVDPNTQEIVGFAAYLLLNYLGLQALLADKFNARDPQLEMLCRRSETPAALFGWGIVARGFRRLASEGMKKHLDVPRFQIDAYGRAATPDGVRFMLKRGAVPVRAGEDPMSGCLMVVRNNTKA